MNGARAARAGRPYGAWIGTTVDAEWGGRAPGLRLARRGVAAASLSTLRRIEKETLRGAARLYATSASSRDDLAAAAGTDDVGILPIPVDVDHLVPASEEEWRATLDQPTIVFVGRADDPRKNISLLLDAVGRLPDTRLRLVGARPREPLPNRVSATGFVTDIAEAFRGGTIFALTSCQEGFGVVAAEALAAGLPVVTTPSGGPEELVRRSGGGRVVDGFDAQEFADALADMLGDPESLAAMRLRGRVYVEREHAPARLIALLHDAFADLDAL